MPKGFVALGGLLGVSLLVFAVGMGEQINFFELVITDRIMLDEAFQLVKSL